MGETCGTRKRKIDYLAVADIVPFARNSRTHSDAQVMQIAASIQEFGWTNPLLVDETNTIIAGHGRLLAAMKLGHTTVPCVVIDGLTDAQRRALVIADNKLALNAGWDEELLSSELQGLLDDGLDLKLLGFDETELGNLLIAANFEPGNENDQGQLDRLSPQMVICPQCSVEFDARAAA